MSTVSYYIFPTFGLTPFHDLPVRQLVRRSFSQTGLSRRSSLERRPSVSGQGLAKQQSQRINPFFPFTLYRYLIYIFMDVPVSPIKFYGKLSNLTFHHLYLCCRSCSNQKIKYTSLKETFVLYRLIIQRTMPCAV